MTSSRVLGLLAFYDESPLWLSATITSAAPHIDHMIVCDGAYALYPDGQAQSRSDQANAIVETCQAASLGLTLHRPPHVWYGNEVEKRNHMWRLAEQEAEPNVDWYMVLDADEIIIDAPHDLRHQLANTDHDTAEVRFWERGDPYRNPARLEHEQHVALPQDSTFPVRILFRAIPGLHCDTAHHRYRTPDGRLLFSGHQHEQEPEALDLTGQFRIEHRTNYRPKQRHDDAQAYYRRRDQNGAETGHPATTKGGVPTRPPGRHGHPALSVPPPGPGRPHVGA